jgi:magnesium-protoporphyrin O-methyltransferase
MNCCTEGAWAEFFTTRVARRDARRYRRRGLDATGRRIVELVRRRGVQGKTVLEVGGGIGAIQLEVLRAGAGRATNVELSPAYEPFAAALVAESGLHARVDRRILDFAEHPDAVEPANVVILHRVVCCYPDYEALVGAAADHAHEQLVLTFPRAAWWMRAGIALVNLFQRLRRQPFRVYLHSPAAIVSVAESRRFQSTVRERGLVWELAEFARS